MRRNRSVIAGVLLLIVLGSGGIFYWMKQRPQKRAPKPVLVQNDSNLNASLSFHPDEVREIKWFAGSKQLKFKRDSQIGSWKPKADLLKLQDRLNLLSRIHLRAIKGEFQLADKDVQKYHLVFFDGKTWQAEFDGTRIRWTSGAFAGFGTTLSESQRLLLLSVAPDSPVDKVTLCRDPVVSLKFQQKQLSLSFRDHQWQSEKPIENLGTRIEEWLSQYCVITPDYIYDISVLEKYKKRETLVLLDRKGRSIEVEVYLNRKSNRSLYSVKQGSTKVLFGSLRLDKAVSDLEQMFR